MQTNFDVLTLIGGGISSEEIRSEMDMDEMAGGLKVQDCREMHLLSPYGKNAGVLTNWNFVLCQ